LADAPLAPRAKLHEAAAVYRQDKETLDWHVMQDVKVRRPWVL
jgi:hypothetical protein